MTGSKTTGEDRTTMKSGAPTEQELQAAAAWFEQRFALAPEADGAAPAPLAFEYDGQPAGLGGWRQDWAEVQHDAGLLQRTLTWTHEATGLQVRAQASLFTDFPAVEWVVYLRNTGAAETPILSEILALDAAWPTPEGAPCALHYARGSDCRLNDFEPQRVAFTQDPATPQEGPSRRVELGTHGRSSEGTLPFFNLQIGEGGVMGAIGWTGGWKLVVSRDDAGDLRLQAGMRRTHLKLLPGEEIRTPRIMLLFWQGQATHGHNVLRQFMLEHHTPHPGGELLVGPLCNAVWGENLDTNQIAKARWWVDNDLPLDYFWIDAGWYGDGKYMEGSTVFNSEWGMHAGNWWPNKGPYPNGLKPVGDALREMGLGFVLWFEPERVRPNTQLAREHPEWLLGPIGPDYLFNLGLPEARQAMTDLISGIIAEAGVTCYRQDFNMDSQPYWDAADAPDRVGMTEIRHIEGLYAMWDELLARHEGLIIDNCSSGGRRIDLEMVSRSIALWRSDLQCYPGFDVLSQQTQLQGLAPWVPLSTGCCDRRGDYAFRSALGPGMVLSENIYEAVPEDQSPQDWLRARMSEARALRPYFYGDLYPLLSFSLATDAWAATQWNRPDLGEGCVLAFRRQDSPLAAMEASLQGLDPAARYEVRDLDEPEAVVLTGEELAAGLKVEIADRPGAKVVVYRRL
jgi:alpha-galactosidase